MKKSTLKKRQARLATATQQLNRQINKDLAALQKQLADQIVENQDLKQELKQVKAELKRAYASDRKHIAQKMAAQKVISNFKMTQIKLAGGVKNFIKKPEEMRLKLDMHVGGTFDGINFGCRNADANRGMAGAFNRLETDHPGLYNELASYVVEGKLTWQQIGSIFAYDYFEDRSEEDRFYDYSMDLNWTYESGFNNFIRTIRFKAGAEYAD